MIVNIILFGMTFYHTVSEDYGESSPCAMLEMTSTAATTEGLPDNAVQKLRQYNIWAMYLTPTGKCFEIYVPKDFMASLPCNQFIAQPLDRNQGNGL